MENSRTISMADFISGIHITASSKSLLLLREKSWIKKITTKTEGQQSKRMLLHIRDISRWLAKLLICFSCNTRSFIYDVRKKFIYLHIKIYLLFKQISLGSRYILQTPQGQSTGTKLFYFRFTNLESFWVFYFTR